MKLQFRRFCRGHWAIFICVKTFKPWMKVSNEWLAVSWHRLEIIFTDQAY